MQNWQGFGQIDRLISLHAVRIGHAVLANVVAAANGIAAADGSANNSDPESGPVADRENFVQFQVAENRCIDRIPMEAVELGEIHLPGNGGVAGRLQVVAIGGFEVVVAKAEDEFEFFAPPGKFHRIPLGPSARWGGLGEDFRNPPRKLELSGADPESKVVGLFIVRVCNPSAQEEQREGHGRKTDYPN